MPARKQEITKLLMQSARNEQAEIIYALHRMGLEEAGNWSADPTLDSDLMDIEYHYAAPGIFLLALMEDGQLAGMAALRPCGDDVFEVKRMRVAQPLRGRGIGRQLLATLIEHARRHGARQLLLDTARSQVAAQRLYRQFGFVNIASAMIGGIDSLLYRLDLSPP
ncbi:GNAT family N-acetyltransferase [Chromobacterium violaceum]|uniref:GNAT family N-acetyltransferase n=1 Tax=Chromobacterium violaceum TaxID=536 RepID=UPI001B331DED|nr:GNAT family N-acetyltransferase [Chromobacterium violaceum]MBP4045111.1 GNAT family N-acetyltransferase [Chromobacterium violaceum]